MYHARCVMVWTLSITLATWSSRTGRPLRYDTTICRNSSALFSCPFARMLYVVCGPNNCPVGCVTFQFCSAASISLMPDLLGLELVRIDLDADGVLGGALHVDLRDAVHRRDARGENVFRVFVDRRHVERVRREVDAQDRLVGRIQLAERRRRRQRGRQERHRRGDGGLDVRDRAVDVAVQVERERDVACCRCGWTTSSRRCPQSS